MNLKDITITLQELTILEAIDKEWLYIVRNAQGQLYLHKIKPIRSTKASVWQNHDRGYHVFTAFNHLFKFIQWEDEEPYRIDELIAYGKSQQQTPQKPFTFSDLMKLSEREGSEEDEEYRW